MMKIIRKIVAWLHGQSYLQAFIDQEIKTRLDKLYLGMQVYAGFTFANRKQFYIYLLMEGLNIMEKLVAKYEEDQKNEQDTDTIFVE